MQLCFSLGLVYTWSTFVAWPPPGCPVRLRLERVPGLPVPAASGAVWHLPCWGAARIMPGWLVSGQLRPGLAARPAALVAPTWGGGPGGGLPDTAGAGAVGGRPPCCRNTLGLPVQDWA